MLSKLSLLYSIRVWLRLEANKWIATSILRLALSIFSLDWWIRFRLGRSGSTPWTCQAKFRRAFGFSADIALAIDAHPIGSDAATLISPLYLQSVQRLVVNIRMWAIPLLLFFSREIVERFGWQHHVPPQMELCGRFRWYVHDSVLLRVQEVCAQLQEVQEVLPAGAGESGLGRNAAIADIACFEALRGL